MVDSCARRAQSAVDALDTRGAWVEDGQFRNFDADGPAARLIDCATFVANVNTLSAFIASDAHAPGAELPAKTFSATPGFESLQTGEGALTHAFEIGGIASRRMVVPYQIWMLQRMADALAPALADPTARASLERFLAQFEGGTDLLGLDTLLAGCRVRKEGALLYSRAAPV